MTVQTELSELKEKAKQAIITLNRKEAKKVAELGTQELSAYDLTDFIEEGFTAGIKTVGDKFGKGEVFLPELIAAADALKGALQIMEHKLRQSEVSRRGLGKILIATVVGDLHDIGKTMVGSLLSAQGFEVIDLGVDVPTEEIIDTAEEEGVRIIGLSALLTTTIGAQKALIDLLREKDLRKKYKVMIGGAASSKEWAEKIGADAYGADAQQAVEIAVKLLGIGG